MNTDQVLALVADNKEAAIRLLLGAGLSTPALICDTVTGATLVDECVVLDDTPWHADDGNAEMTYPVSSAREAAVMYVSTGDWGDDLSGSVSVRVWRTGIDADGDLRSVDLSTESVDLAYVLDHGPRIRAVMGDEGCGDDPAAHDWTSEGEGGADNNPGVWLTGGTSMKFVSHCRCCGLRRIVCTTGAQRNPDEGDSVEYAAGECEINNKSVSAAYSAPEEDKPLLPPWLDE